jgi:hypothetical protein
MNKKMMYALVSVVLIIVVVAGAGAYVLMNNGNGGNTVKVTDATSLQYDAEVTYQGDVTQFKWAAKNVGTSDMSLRFDILHGGQSNYTYILNGADQKAWMAVDGNWTDVSTDFTNQWNTWVGTGMAWSRNLDSLATNWSGTGDYTYADSATGTTTRIYNVVINPTLADSLFATS